MSARRNAGLRTISIGEVERQPALQRIGQKPLQGGARQNLRHEPLRPLGLACRHWLPFELGARERLGHHSLDDPMLDERPRDRFRERPRRTPSTTCSASGAREHLPGHGLEPAARSDLGASTGLGETLGATSKRSGER